MSAVRKLGRVARAARTPRYWNALVHAVVPTIEHKPAFVGIEPAAVIDVGANKGQFCSFARARWPKARLIAFEPLAGPSRRFRSIFGDSVELHNVALGDHEDELDIHIASRADSSSLLPLGERQKRVFAMEEVSTQRVPVRRLDAVIDVAALPQPALLKIDVQGFEYEVLLGLGALRDAIRWIFVEVSFVELYEGQRLYPEVEALARRLGFERGALFNEQHADGRLIQADAIFVRAHPAGDMPPAPSDPANNSVGIDQ